MLFVQVHTEKKTICRAAKVCYTGARLTTTMAHKKAAGSTQNVRDSKPKYLGVKKFGGEVVTTGNVVVRQRGLKYKAGHNVFVGRDDTLHAGIDGKVAFREVRAKRFDGKSFTRTVVDIVAA